MAGLGNVHNEIEGMGLGRRNYEAVHNFDAKTNFSTLHSHDFYEIYINVRGGIRYVLDDQILPLTGNDLLIVRPYQMHGHFGADPLFDYERIFLYITPEVIEELSHNILPINRIFEQAVREHRYFCHLTDEQLSRAASLIDKIKENCANETPYTRLHDVALMTEFLLLVLDCIQSKLAVLPEQAEKSPLIQQVLNYINDNFDQKLSLDDIANHFFVSKSYLSHKFVYHTSRSIYDYILYCRINKAKRLITDGAGLTSVSYQCGFNDYSGFLRTFTRYVGCSPSDYRKRLQSGAGLSMLRESRPSEAKPSEQPKEH